MAAVLRYFTFKTLSYIALLSERQLLNRSLYESCLSKFLRVLKLLPELRVDSLVRFFLISEKSESSLLRWESLRIWRLRGFRESLRAELNMRVTGWLSLRSRLEPQGAMRGRRRKERWEWSMVEFRALWQRVSRQCIDCRLKSCTDLSSMLMLEVRTIQLSGRKYLTRVLSPLATTPHLDGLNDVRMECLARWMANSMNCLCNSLTVALPASQNTSSSLMGTQAQQRSMKPCSASSTRRRLMQFLWDRVLRVSTFSRMSPYSLEFRQWILFLIIIFEGSAYQSSSWPKGNSLPFIQWITDLIIMASSIQYCSQSIITPQTNKFITENLNQGLWRKDRMIVAFRTIDEHLFQGSYFVFCKKM